jgi:hypothetical protein
LRTTSHLVQEGNETIFNSAIAFFDAIQPRESFKSKRFLELLLDFSTDMSDRHAAERLNRVRLETRGINPTTFRNVVEREGLSMQEHIEQQCAATLEENGITINESGELQSDSESNIEQIEHIPEKEIQAAAAKIRIASFNPSDYESCEKSVNISPDGIYVKRQTECRPRGKNAKEQPKRVANTIIHVEKGDGRFVFNSGTVDGAFRQLASFLAVNDLLETQLVFFVDGARDLNNAISTMFGKLNFKVLLDWYHLDKKCLEQLSMALKGSKIRNECMNKLRPLLWFGNVDKAIQLLHEIEPEKVKNKEVIDKLIGYLDRVQNHIPCYALRKELGLRNSSNTVEKSNDILVAKRQKRNGMSWSEDGSIAFASVAAAKYNGQLNNWVDSRSISFSLAGEPIAA